MNTIIVKDTDKKITLLKMCNLTPNQKLTLLLLIKEHTDSFNFLIYSSMK